MRRFLLFTTAALVSTLGLGCTDGLLPTLAPPLRLSPCNLLLLRSANLMPVGTPTLCSLLTEDANGQIVERWHCDAPVTDGRVGVGRDGTVRGTGARILGRAD